MLTVSCTLPSFSETYNCILVGMRMILKLKKIINKIDLPFKAQVGVKPTCNAEKLIITNNQRFLVSFLLNIAILSSISWLSLITWIFVQSGSLILFRAAP